MFRIIILLDTLKNLLLVN